MFGKAHVSFPGVDVTSGSAQDIPAAAEKAINYAYDQKIPVELHDMVASSIGVGAVSMEGIYKSGSSIIGKCPAIGADATIASGKVTFTT